MSSVVGVDLGGTNLAGARVDGAGRVLARRSAPTPAAAGAEAVIAAMIALASELRDEATAAVGACSPGVIDSSGRCVVGACNIPGWEGMPIAGRLAAALGLPAFADNDARSAALAECWVGAGRGAEVCLMLTLGTGVGGGAVIAGRAWRGASFAAGEFGHMSIDFRGARCACGGTGCAEAYASANALARLGSKRLGRRVSAQEVCEAARAGEAAAAGALDEYCAALAALLGSLINSWNPDRMVIGGGVSLSWDLLAPRVERELAGGRALPGPLAACRLEPAALGDGAGVIGAAKVAWNGLEGAGA